MNSAITHNCFFLSQKKKNKEAVFKKFYIHSNLMNMFIESQAMLPIMES
jgi:hypothetical protein